MDLRIDPEFASRIPPLTDDEYQQLEANILEDGVVINPIIVWDGVIVDGHNRFRILEKHPHIKYSIHEKAFNNRFTALAWICKNQLGRRNLTKQQKKYLIGKQFESEKATQGGNHGNQYTDLAKCQNGTLPNLSDAAKRIAKENGIGRRSVFRAEDYSKAVDLADEIEPGIRADILSSKVKATEKDVEAIIQATPAERPALIAKLRVPPQKPPNENSKDKRNLQRISEEMGKPGKKATQSDMLYELNDAISAFILRWKTCLATNAHYLEIEECRAQIQQLAQMGLDYLNQIKNGEIPK